MKYFSLLCLLFLITSCYKGKDVDLIIHNANVNIMNDQLEKAEAIAIKDGKIVEVGPERQILNKYASDQIINAQKKDVFPGFHDAHGHLTSLAKQRLSVDLRNTSSYYEVIGRLEKHQSKKQQEIIIGRGWDQSLWNEKELPNNDLLNKAFPTVPVALTRIDGHAMLINNAMMEHVGITDTTTIDGGVILKKDGKLTGILLDHAIDIVNFNIPDPSKAEIKASILDIQSDLLAAGITHIHEAGLYKRDLDILIELAEENALEINIYAMLLPTENNIQFAKENGHYQNNHLSVQSFKVIADGALGSHGACMINPYSDDSTNHGILLKSPERIKEIFNLAKKLNFQVNSHCIGDSANRLVLNIIDTLMKDRPDHRWRIEHAQIVNPQDLKLFASSGVLPSVQPTHATSDQRWAENHIGKERLNNGAYAYNSLYKQSGMIIFGTDFPIEHYDPFATIHAAVQRKSSNNEPIDGFVPKEAVDLSTTLKAMTLWAAYGCFGESKYGSLEKGKQANISIFDQKVQSTSSFLPNYAWLTIVEGEIVFDMR
ncbi:amidohydrolase [Brumimicrobium aurantiacum]|uniref:Amidohydrolase n=1 Tax=Brumimicrobium aurantiacum TaxID=1737063 RepID=A0A3E1EWM0_9FLAO|nr:amidohydrolase [Brumimicrobium aurantiacum]RFC53955.1 amidohydrolase [Brumimicrobium aurantiacum]